jgi:hypothetical protein
VWTSLNTQVDSLPDTMSEAYGTIVAATWRAQLSMSDERDLAQHYELAYEEAKRALDAQEAVVNELRSRAGVLIGNYVEHPGGSLALPAIHRDLALHMSASYSANADQLRWLFIAFRAGAVLLVAEVGAWVVNLSVGA